MDNGGTVKVTGQPNSLAPLETQLEFLSVQTQLHLKKHSQTLVLVDGTPAAGDTTVGIDNGGGSVGDGGAKFNVGDIVHFQEADGLSMKFLQSLMTILNY